MSLSLQGAEKFWNQVCFDPAFKPRGRYRTYRDLILGGLEDATRSVCPVARSILSEAEWRRVFLDFLGKSPPQSHILRDVAYEFADFLREATHPLASKYPYLGELVEYEVAEIKLRFAPEPGLKKTRGKVALNPVHFLGSYRWPVHFISEKFRDPKKLPRGDYRLLLWRHPETLDIQFLEMNPLTAGLLTRLKSGPRAPQALLKQAARDHGLAADPDFMAEGLGLIQSFRDQGIFIS